jgi:amidase
MFERLRRRLVIAISFAALAACGGPPAGETSGYAWKSIAELKAEIADGRSDARALTAAALARVAQLDSGGPRIHSVIELNPDADGIARALDAADAAQRGPLHGIPVLVKANIDTGDSMATTAGSLALAGHIAPDDADLVRRLRDAGAVLLGKTNLSEWANYRSSRSVSGWSGIGGQTPTHTCSTATLAAPPAARGRRSPRASCRWRSAPKPTARSSARRVPTVLSA